MYKLFEYIYHVLLELLVVNAAQHFSLAAGPWKYPKETICKIPLRMIYLCQI
jgi:hypothetical protein